MSEDYRIEQLEDKIGQLDQRLERAESRLELLDYFIIKALQANSVYQYKTGRSEGYYDEDVDGYNEIIKQIKHDFHYMLDFSVIDETLCHLDMSKTQNNSMNAFHLEKSIQSLRHILNNEEDDIRLSILVIDNDREFTVEADKRYLYTKLNNKEVRVYNTKELYEKIESKQKTINIGQP